MMNLTARTPSFVSSSASTNPGRTSYGYQNPERYVLDDRTGQLVETSRSDYLQKDYGLSWSSQEWKSGDGEHDRSGKPEDTEDVFVIKGETSRSHEIDEKGLHKELGSSDRSGKPEELSGNIRVKHAHDGTG